MNFFHYISTYLYWKVLNLPLTINREAKTLKHTTAKRWFIFILGIQFLAIGVIFNTRTGLGVAAFTSVFYAISQIYGISLGTASILMYIVLIAAQTILLRKISPAVMLQIPFSLVFGCITDVYDSIIPFHDLPVVPSFFLLFTAFVFTSLGVYLTVQCNLVVTPVEGIVNTISQVFRFNFSIVKNVFDLSMIAITVVLCLILKQPIIGIGIGTVLSAVMIGRLISIYQKKLILFRDNAPGKPA